MDDKPTASEFSSLAVTPIAALSPEIDTPEERYIHAVVILLWPFSSATKQFRLLLSEPDFRLRGGKGQIRAIFSEGAAEAVAKSNIGIGDTIFLGLQGARWRSNSHEDPKCLEYTEWDLSFCDQVLLEAQRTSIPLSIVNLKTASRKRANTESAEPPTTPKKLSDGITSPLSTTNQSWTSPAFARVSNASYSSPLFDSYVEEDGYIPGKGRKRTKFGRPSSEWVFVDSAPSPTKEGDMWDDEDIAASDEEPIEQAIETKNAPLLSSSGSPSATKEGVNVDEFKAQGFEETNGDIEPPSDGTDQVPEDGVTFVPPILKLPEVTQDVVQGVYTESFATEIETLSVQRGLYPDLPQVETPRLRPVASPNVSVISPLGTSIGTSTDGSSTPADLPGVNLPIIDPATHGMAEPAVHIENRELNLESDGVTGDVNDLHNQETLASLNPHLEIVAQYNSQSGNWEEPPSAVNDTSPSNVEEELEMQVRGSQHIRDTGSDEESSVYSDASSEIVVEGEGRGRAISVGSSEEASGDDDSSQGAAAPASDLEESPSPHTAEHHYVSSNSDTSSDEANENLYPRLAATETTEKEVFVIHDDGSEASESEIESIAHVQRSESLDASVRGDRDSSVHRRSFSLGESASDEPAEDNASGEAVESGAASVTSDVDTGEYSSSPARMSNNDMSGSGAEPSPEAQITTASFTSHAPTMDGNCQPTESSSPQPGLQQYLSDAIRDATNSHMDSSLVVSYTNTPDPHGEDLMSSFLAPQPTDFITPGNTQDSWVSFGSHPQHLSFPIHLDPNLPTPQPSQITEPTLISTSFTEDQPGAKATVDGPHSHPILSHPNTSSSVSTEIEEAKQALVDTRITKTISTSSGEIHEVARQTSPSESAPMEGAMEPSVDTEFSGLRTTLSYFCPLSRLLENFNQSVDCISIVVDITPISRATRGAKDYHVNLRLTDKSLGGSTTAAQIFHKTKDALPMPAEGDVILLRNLRVQSLNHNMVLNSTDNSAWVYFPQDAEDDAQIDGAPVEFGFEEQTYATQLRAWYEQEGTELVAKYTAHETRQESVGASSRSTSEAGSHLKTIFRKRRRPRKSQITVHELRHGRRYADIGSTSDNESIHELRNGTLYAHPD
ncbi:hypothetical protein FQN49_004875 [Arthroderma sp. PD_2]|nr:hypothetical protein FQN49_004875 [Arthroderma sp. PD_2]